MKFEFKRAKNGYVIELSDSDDPEPFCYQKIEDEEHEAFADLLRMILDNYGPQDGRHEEKRIYIRIYHGDKYNCKNKPCEYCLPEDW